MSLYKQLFYKLLLFVIIAITIIKNENHLQDENWQMKKDWLYFWTEC